MQAAKDKTNEVLAAGEPSLAPESSIDELLDGAAPPDYLCIQAFVDPTRRENGERIDAARPLPRRADGLRRHARLRPPVPALDRAAPQGRPEHRALFIQIVEDYGEELPIPGKPFGFARLIRAQAAGDFESLRERGRRVARVQLEEVPDMQLGMIGLGRMGGNMTKRLTEGGHEMKTYDPGVESTAATLEELRDQLDAPRAFWMMVPAGKITEDTFQTLLQLASAGDTIVDGGNSNFRDSQRRAAEADAGGIHFVDVGVSGGVWGLKEGYCLMSGGDKEAVCAARAGLHARSRRWAATPTWGPRARATS